MATTLHFSNPVSSHFPVVFADMNSVHGKDTALTRLGIVSANQAEIRVQEEQSFDQELRHTAETISVFVAE